MKRTYFTTFINELHENDTVMLIHVHDSLKEAQKYALEFGLKHMFSYPLTHIHYDITRRETERTVQNPGSQE